MKAGVKMGGFMSRKSCPDVEQWINGKAVCPFFRGEMLCENIIECPMKEDAINNDSSRYKEVVIIKKHTVRVINDDTCSTACYYYHEGFCSLFNYLVDANMTRCDDCKRASVSFIRPLGSVDLLEVLR